MGMTSAGLLLDIYVGEWQVIRDVISSTVTRASDTGKNKMISEMKHVSLLSCHRERQLYRMESLFPPGHILTPAVLRNTTKLHHLWVEWWAAGTGQNEENCVFSLPMGGFEFLSIRTAKSTTRERVIKSGRVLTMFRKRQIREAEANSYVNTCWTWQR